MIFKFISSTVLIINHSIFIYSNNNLVYAAVIPKLGVLRNKYEFYP